MSVDGSCLIPAILANLGNAKKKKTYSRKYFKG